MKHVFNTDEVAHIWASQQQDEGRNAANNFYFRGATIYSYGSHFPIATIEGNDVLFTLHSYSNTTAKHIHMARGAVSHKNIIYCFDVPVKYSAKSHLQTCDYFTREHENNLEQWKKRIQGYILELGNKRNRDITGRVNSIANNVEQLEKYVAYFKLKIKDKELRSILKMVKSENFIEQAKEAKEKEDRKKEMKLSKAKKAFDKCIDLWRNFDSEGYNNLDDETKNLYYFYERNGATNTRLRYNKDKQRVETSKGVQIPEAIAKQAYLALNGCFMSTCNNLSIPVMGYTITKSTKEYIVAGCHVIPNEDVTYIAKLLKW